MKVDKGSLRQILSTVCIALTPVIAGTALGYTSPAIPSLQKREGFFLDDYEEDSDRESWIGSVNALAAVPGSLIASYFADYFGPKRALQVVVLPMFCLSMAIVASSYHISMMFIGRTIGGLATGMTYVCTSMFIVETTQPKLRGLAGGLGQVGTNTGVLLVYTVGVFVNWQIIMYIFAGCCIPVILILFLIPESPVWLMKQGRRDEAMRALVWLRATDEKSLEEEINQITKKFEVESANKISLKLFKQSWVYKPCLIAFALMFFKQTSGVNAMVYFLSPIFDAAGSDLSPNVCAVIFGSVQEVMTVFGCMLVDKLGRRVLQIFSSSVMVVTLTLLGIYFYWMEHDVDPSRVDSTGWLPLASILIFISGYSFGYGPLPNMVSSELIPAEVRTIAVSLAQATNWGVEFVVCELFLPMSDGAGEYACFWMYGGFCFFAILFVFFIQPETKGKSLDEIKELFKSNTDFVDFEDAQMK